ncbi:MAG: hypothetical protein ACJASG_001039 [Oleiphilaceae bacterium]|jgi:hypothetical protein
MLRFIATTVLSIIVLIAVISIATETIYGGGGDFPDRTTTPTLSGDALEVVANLDYPPGNIAVSSTGRIFFTFHPEGRPPFNIAELIDGKAIEIPINTDIDLRTVLSMRIDHQNRLWILDYADHGSATPQLVAIDLGTMKVVHHYEFSSDIAGLGSHLNDFQVSQDGSIIYIANASILGLNPSIIIYSTRNQTAREVLLDHESVKADFYVPSVEGEKMLIFGVFAIRPGVDSIALDRNGEWLYFAPVTDEHLHRIRTSDLNNLSLNHEQLAQKVERFGEKTMSDGITTDNAGNIYLSDIEHSAIVRMKPDASLKTLIKDPKLRWPDGFSFGLDGWLYVTSSALQDVIGKTDAYIAEHGPYQIFRIKTGVNAAAGH